MTKIVHQSVSDDMRIYAGIKPELEEVKSSLAQNTSEMKRNKIDVKTLGIKGDGTDETISIQSVINANKGRLYFPEGNYKLTETITINKSGVFLEFSPNAKVSFEKVAQNTPAFKFVGSQGSVGTVSQNIVEGDSVLTLTSVPVDFAVGDWIQLFTDEIMNVHSRSFDQKREFGKITAIDQTAKTITLAAPVIFSYNSTLNTKVTKQVFLNNVGMRGLNLNGIGNNLHYGVVFERCFKPVLSDSYIVDIGNAGIYIQDSIFGFATNNFVQINYADQLQYGIVVNASSFVVVSGNQIHSARTSIDVTRVSSFVTVNANTSYDGGINTHTAKYVTLSGNIIHGNGFLIRGSHVTLEGNTAYSGNIYGVAIQEAASGGFITIKNNLFKGMSDFNFICGNISLIGNIFEATDYLTYDTGTNSSLFRFDVGSSMNNILVKDNIINYIGTNPPPKYGFHMWGLGVANNVTFEGNTITGTKTPISMMRQAVFARKHLKINNNILKSTGDYGIEFGGWDNVEIKGNQILGVNQITNGIRGWGGTTESYSNYIIKDNMIENVVKPFNIFGGDATLKLVKKAIITHNLYISASGTSDVSGVSTTDGSLIVNNF